MSMVFFVLSCLFIWCGPLWFLFMGLAMLSFVIECGISGFIDYLSTPPDDPERVKREEEAAYLRGFELGVAAVIAADRRLKRKRSIKIRLDNQRRGWGFCSDDTDAAIEQARLDGHDRSYKVIAGYRDGCARATKQTPLIPSKKKRT